MQDNALFVSVDVDSFDRYLALYGQEVGSQRPELVEATWKLGVRRFQELFEELGIPAVFFVVGEDLLRRYCGRDCPGVGGEGPRNRQPPLCGIGTTSSGFPKTRCVRKCRDVRRRFAGSLARRPPSSEPPGTT